MVSLKESKCEICQSNSPRLTSEQFNSYLDQLPDWNKRVVENIERITKIFKFKNFKAAMDFSNQIGRIAEEQNHHPVISIQWGEGTVTWWTHAIDGLHLNDLIMAAKTDEIYHRLKFL